MITVRAGLESDLQKIVEYQLAMAWETEELALDRPTVEKGVGGVFAMPSRGSYLIAERDGEVVACALTVPEWSDWRNGTVLWIHSVYVVPEARRKGVFRTMYAHLRQKVEASEELKGLRLYVERDNQVAQQVYRAMAMDDQHYSLFEWLC